MTEHNKPTTVTLSEDFDAIILTRREIVAQIEARLTGQIDDGALAAWAFDRFYAEEVGAEDYEEGAEPLIHEALDALMFGDDPSFRLSEEELRALTVRLQVV